MANALQLRRGTTTQHSTFTGLAGEVTVDTTKDTVVVHDGATAGGIPLALESDLPTDFVSAASGGTFSGDVTVSGNITTTGYIAGPATFTIDPSAVGDNTGTVVIAGNLQVDGTSTTINSTTLDVSDLQITVASGAASAAAANNAGLKVDGANAVLEYLASGDKFSFNKALDYVGGTSTGSLSVRQSDISKGVLVTNLGSLEIWRNDGVPYIDFKSSSAEDYDCRIQQQTNGLEFSVGGNGSTFVPFAITGGGDVLFRDNTSTTKIYWDQSASNFTFQDNIRAAFGNSNDATIKHDGTNFSLTNGTGNTLYYSGGVSDHIFHTNSTQRLKITGAGNIETVNGSGVTVDGSLSINEVIESVGTSASTSGTIFFNVLNGSVKTFTANQTANRTINFTGDGSTQLNSVMAVDESVTVTALMTQGSTAYYLNAYQIDGTAVTPKWSGGSAPTGGNASGIDVYTFTIIKTANATFTVLASLTQYA